MREFGTAYGEMVDLDDPKTYCYMHQDIEKVRFQIHQEIGFCYCYVNYWHKPWNKEQEMRLERLFKKYANEWRNNINNLQWHQEMLYLIQDENENMC